MKEIWNDIKGYEGYYKISNFGNVKGIKRVINQGKRKITIPERSMGKHISNTKYYSVVLSKQGKRETKHIHRLIAESFIDNKELKLEVNHIDGNKLNNEVANLEWCTHKENMDHAYDNKLIPPVRGTKHGNNKFSESEIIIIRDSYKLGYTQKQISKWFGASQGYVNNVINKRIWAHI